MAASNPQWHSRAAKAPSPPNANSSLSPASGGLNPVSFQTNVNRAKTKRWLEAKQYSYDGGDWGDEDDNQGATPVAPRPPYASHRPGSSSELSSGRYSGPAYGSDESRASPSAEAQRNSGGDQKAAPFIRPADIYKRMREERSSTDSGYPAEAPQSAAQPGGVTGSSDAAKPSKTSSLIGLPEVKRISAFGTDFLHGGDSSFQPKTSSESQEPSLQHNPSEASSHGLRSIVHQAFDVPETPNSTAGSVGRSNSDGTSSVSPIMSNRGWTDDKTPTIPEEPAESNTPTKATAEPPSFKPGHRRDVSLPSPDNSPLKRPTVTDHTAPASDHAEVSSISTVQPVGADSSSQRTSMLKPSTSAEKDFVAPLNIGSNGSAGAEGYRGDNPPIAPTGHSPQDADNDRLREEIIRSLSREGSQETEYQPQSHGAAEDSIPRQYEKFWEDGAGHSVPSPHQGSNVLVSESHPHWTGSHSMGSRDPYAANQAVSGEAPPVAAEPPAKPRMARRFSWESSSEEEEPQLPGNFSSPPPLGAALATQEPEPIPNDSTPPALAGAPRESPMADGEVSDSQKPEKPRLSIVPPVSENGNPPEQIAGPVDRPTSHGATILANVGTLDIDESKLKGFREILNITAPGERIRAFDHTRDQFAALNTGLNHWLVFTAHDRPEHADLVQVTQSLSADVARTSPSSRRFPKLTSFGNLASKDENAPASVHNRRPSGHAGTIQNVEQRGKVFLHTAGAFSGKAGVAAKGLFAKGRSKFRPSGDKGQSRSFRKSLQGPGFSSESNASSGNFSFRNAVPSGGLPVSKHDRNVSSPAVLPDARDMGDGEPPGKRSKYSDSGSRSNVIDGAINRRASQGFAGRSHAARNFEREMDAALGLSPTESRPHHQTHDKTTSNDPPVTMKILPLLQVPGRPSDGAALADAAPSASLNLNALETTIRPVSQEEIKPSTPPKDLPPRNPPPEVPPKDLPPKDLPQRDNPLKNLLDQDSKPLPQSSHSQRQPSVSTLDADERMVSRPAEGEVESPPSPIQLPTKEAEPPVYVKSLPLAAASGTSLPSVEENTAGFTPMDPRRQTSAQILDSKRRSISGMPDVQSPLRNEVRYSPGTRSSMMSWSSFGRRSTNTRPGTPANGLSHGALGMRSNGNSKMEKLKDFGKRRRASVGDILSGIQENIQGGLQGIPEGSKRKRTFSRISGLFNRSHEFQHGKQDGRSRNSGQPSESKPLSNSPFTQSSAAQHGRLDASSGSAEKALPALPAESESTSVAPFSARECRQRASMPLPPSSSSPSLASGRFYSRVPSMDAPSADRHTRVKSQPMMPAAPLSPIAPSVSDKGRSPSPHMHDLEERKSQEEQESESRLSQNRGPPFEQQKSGLTDQALYTESPNPSVDSRKSVPSPDHTGISTTTTKERSVSHTPSTLSTHPHRNNEAQVLNETPEPVELAITRDGSSEEIVMSSTAYPGQEWTPMHM